MSSADGDILVSLKLLGGSKKRGQGSNTGALQTLEPDEVVLGGGDVKKLKKLPKGCRAGDNANAFLGGFRLWENTTPVASSTRARSTARSRGQQSTPLGQQGQTRKTEWHNDSQSEYDRIS